MKYDCVVFQLPAPLVHAHVNLGHTTEYNTNSFSWLSYYEGIVQLTKIVIKTCNVRSHNIQYICEFTCFNLFYTSVMGGFFFGPGMIYVACL
jgi:hypothetical protein